MRGFNAAWPELLSGAIEVARSVLRDLDSKEIPAALSRVAAYQGGRLPPPLATRLLRELDENDWFREKVTEAWDDDEVASDLFLQRPGGWWLELTALADTASNDAEQHRFSDLKGRIKQIEAKRAAAAKRVKEYKKAADDAGRALKAAVESAKKTAEDRYSAKLADATSLRVELEAAERRLMEQESEHRELQAAFDALRTRFAKTRRGRFEDREQAGGSRSVPADPVKLARMLDRQAAEFGRDLSEPVAVPRIKKEQLALASGTRPDSSDAIRWLMGLDKPVVVLVDGYNAQFHINPSDFTSGSARRHLVDVLKRLRSQAVAKHRVVVVYDSTLPGERDARTSSGGVEVRFAVEERIADEEIVEMAESLDRAVVITSDRAVREDSEANGAVVLWSEALEHWLHRS